MAEEITSKITTRGLSDGFDTPLREFIGTLASYSAVNDEKFKKVKVTLDFKDIKVIKTNEPYNFPIAKITLNFSEKKRSKWGIFAASLNKHLKENQDIPDAVGMSLHMIVTPGHNFGKDKQTQLDMIQDCWEVAEAPGGAAGVSTQDRLIGLMDGKTEPELNQMVFADPVIKLDTGIVSGLLDKTLVPSLIAKKLITQDDKGIYHKVV